MPVAKELLEPIRFTEVLFDSQGKPVGSILREIPAEPLTDSKIAGLPFGERAEILERMQNTYARPFAERSFHGDVNPATTHLAATIFDIKEKHVVLEKAQNRRATASANYELEKQAIRRGERGGKRIEPKIQAALTSWQKQDHLLAQEETEKGILRSTVVDLFIADLFLKDASPQQFLMSVEDLVGRSSFTKGDVLFLLQQASLRLRSKEKHEDPSFLRYKEGTDGFIMEDQARVLRQVVFTAFSEPSLDNPLVWQLKQVALDLLEFYWRNVSNIFPADELVPHLAFMGDLFYAALSTGDLKIIGKTIDYVGGKLENKKTLSDVGEEFSRAGDMAARALPALVREIETDHHALLPSVSASKFLLEVTPEYFIKWDPEKRRCVEDKYCDLLKNLSLVGELSTNTFKKPDYFGRWIEPQISKMGESFAAYASYEGKFVLMLLTTNPKLLLFQRLILNYETKKQYEETWGKQMSVGSGQMQEEYLREMSHFEKVDPKSGIALWAQALLALMFTRAGIEDVEDMIKQQEERRVLFSRIRDQNIWFVAENGDQYSVDRNPELSDFNIKSLTFYPHSQLKGWRVEIVADIVDKNGSPVRDEFLIDEDGRFLLRNGSPIILANWVRLPFEQFILTRLHFITSGALSQKEPHHKTDEGGRNIEVVRRPHWRTLTATPSRIYTLTSYAAKKHADYVLRVYGKDIYAENLRRRAVGTLKQNQCVTFVKPTTVQLTDPNQIVFDPSLLDQVA